MSELTQEATGPVAEPRAPSQVERRAVGSSAVIPDAHGRVLLVKHNYGRLNWNIPGGASEPGESPVDTVIRECREEIGLEVLVERLTGVYYEPDHPARDFLHFTFLGRLVDRRKKPRLQPDELSDWGYFSLEDLPRPISDLTVQRIRDALSGEVQVLPATVPRSRLLE